MTGQRGRARRPRGKSEFAGSQGSPGMHKIAKLARITALTDGPKNTGRCKLPQPHLGDRTARHHQIRDRRGMRQARSVLNASDKTLRGWLKSECGVTNEGVQNCAAILNYPPLDCPRFLPISCVPMKIRQSSDSLLGASSMYSGFCSECSENDHAIQSYPGVRLGPLPP